MFDENKFDDSLDFVTRNYRHGAFSRSEAWRRINNVQPWWRRGRAVAAAIAGVVLVASACVYKWVIPDYRDVPQETVTIDDRPVIDVPGQKVVKIEFTDESLASVVSEIEHAYGVTVVNMPDEEYRITLSYEGTAADLIDTINELFDIQLEIEQCGD